MSDIGNTSCLLLLCNFKRLCHYQTCVHVCGIVYYHDATQCFASEIQFVYCYSETIIQCAILMFASTFVELYITMLRMSALHRRVKLSIVTLIFYSTAAFSRYASTCVEPFYYLTPHSWSCTLLCDRSMVRIRETRCLLFLCIF